MADLPDSSLRALAARINRAEGDADEARQTLGGLLAWLQANTPATVRELARSAGIPTTTAQRLITAHRPADQHTPD